MRAKERTLVVARNTQADTTYEIIEVDGENGKKNTNKIKVKFSNNTNIPVTPEYLTVTLRRGANGLEGESLYAQVKVAEFDRDTNTITYNLGYPYYRENQEEISLVINNWFTGNAYTAIVVGAKKEGESQITGHAVFKANRREQDYGRTIESVSPYNLYYASTVKTLSLYGYFAQEYNPVTAVIFREKDNSSTEREYSKSELALKATTGVRGKITMDVSRVEMLNNPGEYEVAYKSKDNTISEFVGFNVVEDQGFSQDNYGILAITQKSNREFVIETFKSEDEMQAKKTAGTTLISIRGLLGMTRAEYILQERFHITRLLNTGHLQGNLNFSPEG